MFKSLFQGNYISGGTFNVHVSTSASTSTMVNESPQRKKFRRLRVLDSQCWKVVKNFRGFVLITLRFFSRIVDRKCLFTFFHSLIKSTFLLSKGLLCLYDKQNNTWLLVDMEFLFSCSTRHLTRSLRSFVSYRVKHSKRNSISTRAHVLFSI